MVENVYAVIHRQGGLAYTESPEEQGIADGPPLVRVFRSEEEALRYRDAVMAYTGGDSFTVSEFPVNEWSLLSRNGVVKVELCAMPEFSWAKPVSTIWDPRRLLVN